MIYEKFLEKMINKKINKIKFVKNHVDLNMTKSLKNQK